jgi:uncharacterized Fe-S cluster protein YjdI
MSHGHRGTCETEAIRVDWDSSRCIHTGNCLQTLPLVFDVLRRPWVDLRGAETDAVADAVGRRPTGALRYERLNGAEGERPQRPTVVWPTSHERPGSAVARPGRRATGWRPIHRRHSQRIRAFPTYT